MIDDDNTPLLGGTLCLDFANTLEWRGSPRLLDRIPDYGVLLTWSERAGALGPTRAASLAAYADWAPGSAEAVFLRAFALREAIYQVAAATAAGRAPEERDLQALNREVFELIGETRLEPAAAGGEPQAAFARVWGGGEDALEQVLWPIAWSACELMTGPGIARLRQCANDDCHWLFLDRSKNGSRRWCAMWNCGNVAKARRHRRRRKDRTA